jgi:radical SAM-linked protein
VSYDWHRPAVDGSVPEMMSEATITRIRIAYTKGEALRFIGHLDLQRLWERLLRRSKLPIRHSRGFHPRPRLNLASALPLGFISDAELLDFWMDEPVPIEEIHSRLLKAAPPGLKIHAAQTVEQAEDSLQSQMYASEYEVVFFDQTETQGLTQKIGEFLAADKILRTRRNKTYDLRPLVLNLEIRPVEPGEMTLWMRLSAQPSATGRPDEVLEQLGFENTQYLVRRTGLILKNG